VSPTTLIPIQALLASVPANAATMPSLEACVGAEARRALNVEMQ
jgi:hypothetical protein